MQEFSKYRAITVGFILMFIFVIAAIYTNTKDAVTTKQQNNQIMPQNIESKNSFNKTNNAYLDNQQNLSNEIDNKIVQISDRLSQLEQKVYNAPNYDQQGVRCNIRGIISDGRIVPLSPEESVNESKMNDREVLITCVFK